MSAAMPGALSAGQIFHERYEIVRCLKAGGMGAIYECVHLSTRKRRALKVMLAQILTNAEMRERFELEARVTAEIESEHIVETFDAGIDGATGAPFLVMELLRGEDLASVLKRRGALPAGEVVALLSQAALALDKTHAAGIVHRDLKPDNLFLTARDDGSPRLKILDFGIAKVVADAGQSAQQTATIGTPLYMSQEQILGEGTIGPRADVYAMGHIAFTLLTGEAYWSDEQKASPAVYKFLGKIMAGAIEPATVRAARRGVALPAAFDGWFARSTAMAAGDRFDRVSTMASELAVVLGVRAPMHSTENVAMPDPRVTTARLNDPRSVTAPTMSERTTVVVSSTSVVSGFKGPSLPMLLVAAGLLVLAGVGAVFLALRRGPEASPAVLSSATAAAAAETQAAPVVPPDPAPTATASATEEPTSRAGVPTATAAPVQAPKPPKAPVVKPAAPSKGCDPPYVIDSAGHRRMKPQCL